MSKRFITHKKRIWVPVKGSQYKLNKEESQAKKSRKFLKELVFYVCLALVCIGLIIFL